MYFRYILIAVLVVLLPINLSGGLIDVKPLSPSANVHVDVINHLAASLNSHAHTFHHSWRDYALLFLLIIVIGTALLTCCVITVICIYRRLLFQLVRRSSAPRSAKPMRSTDPPYTIT